jgi:CheY-like chemotaxis protein
MSHELRTPLNAVLGFAEVLLAGYDTPLTDKQRGYVDHILTGGSHLLDLINEVLDLAKVEAGAMTQELEAVQLGSVIEDCVSLSSPIFAKCEVTPVIGAAECNATILADPQRTKQLILNLLSNAAKYNRRGGTVTISCETIENGFHRLIIADTGKGIPDHKQDQMFKPFNRLGADSTATEGTGIGLALTKSMIEAMGGRIGFSSVVDEGSRFWLDFPLCDDKVAPTTVATDGGRKLHYCFEDRLVLYIEDNVFNMRLMEALFEQLVPMRLVSANNAEEGLELARSSQPDVILLDINLPGINGFDAIARLKDDASICHIPVIGLSADASRATVERARKSGFADYLTKPVSLPELVRTLSREMEYKHANQH